MDTRHRLKQVSSLKDRLIELHQFRTPSIAAGTPLTV
jgi:hypothetical protein